MADPRNPWRVRATRTVYENRWIRVREDAVRRPDGSDGIYGVVHVAPSVGVVALDPEVRVRLVGQWRYGVARYSWEIVEGAMDPGEPAEHAAERELREEAGLAAGRLEPLGPPLELSNSVTDERGYLFLARDLEPVPSAPDPTEVLEHRWVPLERCRDLVASGEIRDAMTMVALARLAELDPERR